MSRPQLFIQYPTGPTDATMRDAWGLVRQAFVAAGCAIEGMCPGVALVNYHEGYDVETIATGVGATAEVLTEESVEDEERDET